MIRGVPVRWEQEGAIWASCAGWVLPYVLERGDRYISTFALLAGPLNDSNLPRPLTHQSVKRHVRQQHHHQPEHSLEINQEQNHLRPTQRVGMHPSSITSTPFSVKDILKLEHHHDYENDFLMTDQVVPMHHQHLHAASRRRDFYSEPCVSGMQEKLETSNSAADEEINDQGEK